MPETSFVDILGEVNPGGGGTPTRLYTSPASGFTVASKICVCNQGAATTFRIWTGKVVDTEADAKTRRFFDTPIAANATQEIVGGDCFRNGGWISVAAGTGNVSFQIHGEETTVT